MGGAGKKLEAVLRHHGVGRGAEITRNVGPLEGRPSSCLAINRAALDAMEMRGTITNAAIPIR